MGANPQWFNTLVNRWLALLDVLAAGGLSIAIEKTVGGPGGAYRSRIFDDEVEDPEKATLFRACSTDWDRLVECNLSWLNKGA